MRPILLFYGYYRLKAGRPVNKCLFEDKKELRNAIAARFGHLSRDDFHKRCVPFRCYGSPRNGKIVKIYDIVSDFSLFSDEIQN